MLVLRRAASRRPRGCAEVSHYIILHYTILYYIIPHYITLYHIILETCRLTKTARLRGAAVAARSGRAIHEPPPPPTHTVEYTHRLHGEKIKLYTRI